MTRRVGLMVTVVALLSGLVVDLSRRPEEQWTAAAILAGIDAYQEHLSPRMGVAGVRCRFEPTCSHYAETMIRREGAAIGVWRTAGRLARCGPWTSAGTQDPP